MFQKLHVDSFKWKKNTSKFNESFIRNHDENADKEYIFEVDAEYPKRPYNFHNDLSFLPERMKIKNVANLFVIFMIKTIMLHTWEP